jgi:DNA-binding IclR family transcriptional regulator
MSRVATILEALAERPRTNAELCEVADDIGPYVARTMAKLCARGLAANMSTKRGRGSRALYALVGAPK